MVESWVVGGGKVKSDTPQKRAGTEYGRHR